MQLIPTPTAAQGNHRSAICLYKFAFSRYGNGIIYYVVFCIRSPSLSLKSLSFTRGLVCVSGLFLFSGMMLQLRGYTFCYPLTSWFLVLWPSIWPILNNIPYVHENNVYSAPLIRSVQYIAIRSDWLIMLLRPSRSLLMLCLVVLSIIEKDMKSPILIIQSSAVSFCLI